MLPQRLTIKGRSRTYCRSPKTCSVPAFVQRLGHSPTVYRRGHQHLLAGEVEPALAAAGTPTVEPSTGPLSPLPSTMGVRVIALHELLGIAQVVLAAVRAQVDVDAAHAERVDLAVELGEARGSLLEAAVRPLSADAELLAEKLDLDLVVALRRADRDAHDFLDGSHLPARSAASLSAVPTRPLWRAGTFMIESSTWSSSAMSTIDVVRSGDGPSLMLDDLIAEDLLDGLDAPVAREQHEHVEVAQVGQRLEQLVEDARAAARLDRLAFALRQHEHEVDGVSLGGRPHLLAVRDRESHHADAGSSANLAQGLEEARRTSAGRRADARPPPAWRRPRGPRGSAVISS